MIVIEINKTLIIEMIAASYETLCFSFIAKFFSSFPCIYWGLIHVQEIVISILFVLFVALLNFMGWKLG